MDAKSGSQHPGRTGDRQLFRAGGLWLTELRPGDPNPFREWPVLSSIWAPEMAAIAEEAIDDAFFEHANGFDYGQIFLLRPTPRGSPVGLSGFLPWDLAQCAAGLRWHGLLKDYRTPERSLQIIDAMRARAAKAYPSARRFVEFMPATPEYGALARYFERCGFLPSSPPRAVDWSPVLWQEFSCDLHAPLIVVRASTAPAPGAQSLK